MRVFQAKLLLSWVRGVRQNGKKKRKEKEKDKEQKQQRKKAKEKRGKKRERKNQSIQDRRTKENYNKRVRQ